MVRMSNLATIIVYGGGVVIVYLFLKSWGIISPASTVKTVNTVNTANTFDISQFNWTPLSDEQLKDLQSKTNPSDIYRDDDFYTRTGRNKTGYYGFVGT